MEESSQLLLEEPEQHPESPTAKPNGISKPAEAEFSAKPAKAGKNDAFMDRTEMKLQNHDATLKSLETQVGQISQILNTRPIGGFPRDTEVAKGATHEQSTDAPAKADEPAKAEEDHNDPTNTQTEESLAEPSHTKSDKLEKIRPPHHFHKGPHQPAFSGSIAADAKLCQIPQGHGIQEKSH
ncbi:hypothetical protein V6N12_002637 [Hibiscus sabdariffa]|uniref:Uncharacterized protein n=1 Tax=Hibiscus sabdariffa TaxID=183260 RepID=A0ABR2EBE5_9ROSI